jgi:hypothetical protein
VEKVMSGLVKMVAAGLHTVRVERDLCAG